MKKTFTLLFFIAFSIVAKAQWFAVPDTNFQQKLVALGYSSCMNAAKDSINGSCSMVSTATSLSVANSSISNLQGIQAFSHINTLGCNSNSLTALPTLPNSITYLDCSQNSIGAISSLPNALTNFICYYNLLVTLPTLPNTITYLDCSNNHITSLPSLPTSIQTFNCGYNSLVSLPALPNTLTTLYCYWNSLVSLPTLPPAITTLWCYNNTIISFPTLPNTLTTIQCQFNSLISLPALPTSLSYLDCSYNTSISSLPNLPKSLTYLDISGAAIYCLPLLPHLSTFTFQYTHVTCIPNYVNIASCTPSLNTLPLCGIFRTNSCNAFWNIKGSVYLDIDHSCTYTSTDTALRNIPVQLWQNGNMIQQVFTTSKGEYKFNTTAFDTFQIKINTNQLPYYLSCPSQQNGLTTILTALNPLDSNKNFAMQCKIEQQDVKSMNIMPHTERPGKTFLMHIKQGNPNAIFNYDCNKPIKTGKIKLVKNGPVKFENNGAYSIPPSIITHDSLVWRVNDFDSLQYQYIAFIGQTDTTAQIGDNVHYTLIVEHDSVDANSKDDTIVKDCPISNGHDPNLKSGTFSTIDSSIAYHIEFQNNGNDTAINIIVRDTLNSNLDLSSITITGYSVEPFTQILGNILVFNFPQINLVDSATSEPKSHAYVDFSIKVKQPIADGTIIPNKAAIRFDFNSPIYTTQSNNTICFHSIHSVINQSIVQGATYLFNGNSLNQAGTYTATVLAHNGCDSIIQLNLSITSGISNINEKIEQLKIQPNPTNNITTITLTKALDNATIKLITLTGQTILEKQNQTGDHFNLDISQQAQGIYFIEVRQQDNVWRSKIIKQDN